MQIDLIQSECKPFAKFIAATAVADIHTWCTRHGFEKKKEKRREKSKRERANLRGDVAFGQAAAIVRRLVVNDDSVDAGGSVEYEQQQQQQGQQGKVHHTPHTTQDNTITSIDIVCLF